jgi:ATP-dependent Clp protease protease subunit
MIFTPPTNIMPGIWEETHRGTRSMDIFSRLMLDRIVFLGTEVTPMSANSIIGQLLFLESEDNEKPIHMYINSPGGDVAAGLAIYDTMNYINAPVATLCAGRAMSMGAVLLAGGAPGMRAALPNSSILIHQPLGGAQGQASDIEIVAKEIMRLKKVLMEILAKHTGQTREQVTHDSDRDKYMTADDALAYGIIDRIVTSKADEE